jgi:hypothetical protein
MDVDHIGCPACGHRIKEFEPDIALRKRDGSVKYFYHVRCAREPERIVAREGEDVWRITYRRVFSDLEGGAA